jgi:hypothetical protein
MVVSFGNVMGDEAQMLAISPPSMRITDPVT